MKSDFNILKHKYGEKFAQICRELFPTILEHDGVLTQIITEHFAPTHALADDLTNLINRNQFKNFIYSLYQLNTPLTKKETNATPEELLARVGYILYPECKTEADVQSFRKYYDEAHNELLCTFNGHRLDTNRIWFAVKKNVAEIKREYYIVPERQDEYGTSVLSIQFARDPHHQTLSIKNRYNHSVPNPDCTFSNNLDNIIAGLSQAFEKHYGCCDTAVCERNAFELPGYVKARDGKYYRENFEWNNTSYCENNIIIKNGKTFTFRSDSQILADNYLFDLQTNQVYNLCGPEVVNVFNNRFYFDFKHPDAQDAFTKSLGDIQKIMITKDKTYKGRVITIYTTKNETPCIITLDQHQQITSYDNPNLTKIENYFLMYNRALTNINIPKVTTIGDGVLLSNLALHQIDLPKVTDIGTNFLNSNQILFKINIPNVTHIDKGFLTTNRALSSIAAPKLTVAGNYFLSDNEIIDNVNFPKLKSIGKYFLMDNTNLTHIDLPKAFAISNCFLPRNEKITNINFPNLLIVDDDFLSNAYKIKQISIPNLVQAGNKFLGNNYALKSLSLPELKKVGDSFLENNKILKNLNLPNLTEIGDGFLTSNTTLTPDSIYMPKVRKISNLLYFFCDNFDRNEIINKVLKRQQPDLANLTDFGDDYEDEYDYEVTKKTEKLRHLASIFAKFQTTTNER